MYLINPLTSDTIQTMNLVLPDGSQLALTIRFIPMQYGWFIDSLVYAPEEFELQGVRISNNPNMLYQWKNKLPFGLGCFSPSKREPMLQEDFLIGASQLYLLSSDEVLQLQEFYSGG